MRHKRVRVIIVIAGFDNVRLRRDAKIKRKQRRRTTVRKSLRRPIVLGSLKSSRKKISRALQTERLLNSVPMIIFRVGSDEVSMYHCMGGGVSETGKD